MPLTGLHRCSKTLLFVNAYADRRALCFKIAQQISGLVEYQQTACALEFALPVLNQPHQRQSSRLIQRQSHAVAHRIFRNHLNYGRLSPGNALLARNTNW